MRRLGAAIVPLGSVACLLVAALWWFYQPPGAPGPAATDREMMDPLVLDQINEALSLLREAPRSAARRRRLGMVYEANGLASLAVECYRQLVRLDGDDAQSWYRLGLVLAESGDTAGASEAFGRVNEIGDGYAPALWRLGYIRLNEGDLDNAAMLFGDSLAQIPQDPAALAGLARVFIQRRQPEQAVELLDQVLAVNPDDGYARQQRAAAYRQLGRFEDAARDTDRAAGSEPRFDDAWAAEADRYSTGFSRALQTADRQLASGQVREAVATLEMLRRRAPDRVPVLNNLGIAYVAANRGDDALAVVYEGLAIEPESAPLLVTMSMAYERLGDLPGALASATRAIRAGDSYGPAHKQQGLIFGRQRRYEEAIPALARAADLMGEDAECLIRLGQAQGNLQRWAEAAATFQRASARFSGLLQVHVGLAVARAALGETDAAGRAWARARELGARLEDLPAPVRSRLEGL